MTRPKCPIVLFVLGKAEVVQCRVSDWETGFLRAQSTCERVSREQAVETRECAWLKNKDRVRGGRRESGRKDTCKGTADAATRPGKTKGREEICREKDIDMPR